MPTKNNFFGQSFITYLPRLRFCEKKSQIRSSFFSQGKENTRALNLPNAHHYKGSFTNYVDQILTFSDHLPTYRGLSWTFGAPPTPCPRGHRKTWPPTPMYNMYLVLQLLLSWRRWGYNFQVFFGLLTNPIDIHKEKFKLPDDYKKR